MKMLDMLLNYLHQKGHKILIYSQFTSILDIL
jgi:SNF2 family DNA or RNA helicase